MLTIERKEELANKVQFVKDIEKAILNNDKGNVRNVQSLNYEIYEHVNKCWIEERLVITFKGGAISVRNCNCTSCLGILKSIADIIQGGYYDEVPYYEELCECPDYNLLEL